MALRCEGCEGRFGALGDASVEIESDDSSENTVSVAVRLDVECANCSSELAQAYTDVESEIDVDLHNEECKIKDEDGVIVTLESDEQKFLKLAEVERTFDVVNAEAEVTFEEVKRRRFYNVTVRFDVKCSACGDEWQLDGENEIGTGELEPM